MPDFITIRTARNVEIEYLLASLGDRVLGRIIDSLILTGYMIILIFVYTSFKSFLVVFLLALPAIFYTFLFERFNNGQTPGKNIMQTRVVSLNGDNVTTSMYFLRWVMLLIDLRLVSGVIGIVSILVTEESQRLGDMTAGTAVISLKKSRGLEKIGYRKINPNYRPKYPQANNLKEEDIQIIQSVLKSKADKRNIMISMAANKVEEAYDIPSTDNSALFLRTIINDYNYFQYHSHAQEFEKYKEEDVT